jgi:hypothetical protein
MVLMSLSTSDLVSMLTVVSSSLGDTLGTHYTTDLSVLTTEQTTQATNFSGRPFLQAIQGAADFSSGPGGFAKTMANMASTLAAAKIVNAIR